MNGWQVAEVSPLALAYIGDAVWEVYARNRVLQRGIRRPAELHRAATGYVSARVQARLADALWDHLLDEERQILRRGRNAKSAHTRKSADVLDYRHSTGFEALLGYLYGQANLERLETICALAAGYVEHWQASEKPTQSARKGH
ncbi:MAG: ribonuclease III [Alicyclobacillus sp.]|nr:ribonuclease III [Alicyclobacillus sp.]